MTNGTSVGLTPSRPLSGLGSASAILGGTLFLIGTVLHPVRDGHGIADVGDLYGITHAVQAIGLLFMAVALSNLHLGRSAPAHQPTRVTNLALVGTMSWFGLIVYDGSHNPVAAEHTPDLVHTASSLDPGSAIIVLPAIILFPIGYTLLAPALTRSGHRLTGWLVGTGAVVYAIGGMLIFPLGPDSPLVQPVEVTGAIALSVGYVHLGLKKRPQTSE